MNPKTSLFYDPSLLLCGATLEVSISLKLLGFTLDCKQTFQHIHQMAASISQKIGILRKCYRNLGRSEAKAKSSFALI